MAAAGRTVQVVQKDVLHSQVKCRVQEAPEVQDVWFALAALSTGLAQLAAEVCSGQMERDKKLRLLLRADQQDVIRYCHRAFASGHLAE